MALKSNLFKALLETSESAGIVMMPDDYCCRLLAWLLEYGGGYEAVVYNSFLNAELMHAQKRMNVYGGERPNQEMVILFGKYIKEIKESQSEGKYPEWVYTIHSKYGLPKPFKIETN